MGRAGANDSAQVVKALGRNLSELKAEVVHFVVISWLSAVALSRPHHMHIRAALPRRALMAHLPPPGSGDFGPLIPPVTGGTEAKASAA